MTFIKARHIIFLFLAVITAVCMGCNARTAKVSKSKPKISQSLHYIPPCIAHIVDAKDKPVAGIKVTAVVDYHEDASRIKVGPSAISNEDGEVFVDGFSIAETSNNKQLGFRQTPSCTLVAYEPGKCIGSANAPVGDDILWPIYSATNWPRSIRIQVQNLKKCRGTVVDEDGKPLSGVSVCPGHPEISSIVLDKVAKLPIAVTNSAGSYALPQCPIVYGRQYVKVQKGGYVLLPLEPDVDLNPERIVMIRAGSITGRVVDEDGKPLAGVPMTNDITDYNYPPKWAVTDRKGRFVVNGLLPGTRIISLDPFRSKLLAKPKECIVGKGEIADAGDIVASRGVVVSGRVVDELGERLTGSVSASSITYKHAHIRSANYDHDGFTFRLLPGETYRIACSWGSCFTASNSSWTEVRVPNEGARNIELKVTKVVTGKGRVINTLGKAVRGARVFAPEFYAMYSEGPIYGISRTDARGKFEVPLVRHNETIPDKLQLIITDLAQGIEIYKSVDRDAFLKGNVTLTLKPTIHLRVLVKDKVTKAPVMGAYVYYKDHRLKTNKAGEVVFGMNTRSDNVPITVYKSHGLTHSKASRMVIDSKGMGWSDVVTILL